MAFSRRATADLQALPTFLCPTLQYTAAHRIPRRKRPQASRARQFTSTSVSASLPREEEASLQDGMQKVFTGVTNVKAIDSIVHQNSLQKGKETERRDVIDLAIAQEVINDILERSKVFNSKAESIFLMHETKLLLIKQQHSPISEVKQQVRTIAPKLAFAYLLFDRPTDAIAITQHATQGWNRSDEDELRDLWKPTVSLAYSKALYDEAAQISLMLSKFSHLSGNWMNLAHMQSILRMAESGRRNIVIEKADTLWKAYDNKKESVPEAVMMMILASQIKRGDVEKVRHTLEAIRERKMDISTDVWEALLCPALRGKKRGVIMQLLGDFSKDTTLIVEELIAPLALDSKLRDCLRVLRSFDIPTGAQKVGNHATKPSLHLYSMIMMMFVRIDRPDLAVRFLKLALDTDCQGDYTRSYIRIASAFNKIRKAEEALYVGAQLMDSSLLDVFPASAASQLSKPTTVLYPSRTVYASLLYSTSLISDVTAVVSTTRSILFDMFTKGKIVNAKIRRALCRIVIRLSRNGSLSELIKMNQELFHQKNTWSDDEHDKEGWRKWNETLQKEGVVDHIAISAWYRLPSIQRQEKVNIKEVLGIPFQGPWREITANDFQFEATPSEHLVSYRDMTFDESLSSAALAMRLRVLAVIRRDFQSALDLYKTIGQHQVQASMHHVAPLIEGLVLVNRLKEAHEIKQRALREFPESEIPLRVYGALIRGYGQVGDWTRLMELALEMRNDKIKLNQTFQVAFRTARQMKKQQKEISDEDRDIMDQVKILNRPSKDDYPMSIQRATHLFQHYQQNGQYLIAQRHISSALDAGLKPDRILLQDLSRSENWLIKKLKNLSNDRSLRHHRHLSASLEICQSNRARIPKKDAATAFKQIERVKVERKKLLLLLGDALGSSRLWNEAQLTRVNQEQATSNKNETNSNIILD